MSKGSANTIVSSPSRLATSVHNGLSLRDTLNLPNTIVMSRTIRVVAAFVAGATVLMGLATRIVLNTTSVHAFATVATTVSLGLAVGLVLHHVATTGVGEGAL